jgi:hypothetical protein
MPEYSKSFLGRLTSLFSRPKPRLLGVHWGREIKYSAGMTGYPMYWFYESGDSFMISGFFGAVIRGSLPKCLDRVSDSGKIRYLKRYIPKADRR